MICIKENVQHDKQDKGESYGFEVDTSDNSIIRTVDHYKEIFSNAQLEVIFEMKQRGFPPSLVPVHMFALQPKNVQKNRGVV